LLWFLCRNFREQKLKVKWLAVNSVNKNGVQKGLPEIQGTKTVSKIACRNFREQKLSLKQVAGNSVGKN
jgi:hypothetical protein